MSSLAIIGLLYFWIISGAVTLRLRRVRMNRDHSGRQLEQREILVCFLHGPVWLILELTEPL